VYIKYLTISDKNNNVIRHVEFKKGINIIKGEESGQVGKNNTNSLGKTTLLRCIDFCLCGKWNAFIFDKEIKGSKNNTVFDFFKKSLPSFELLIVKNIDSNITSSLKIKRQLNHNLKAKSEKSYFNITNYINDEHVTDQFFSDTIKKFLFGLETEKPTLRQLLPKFIRTSDHQITNIIKYLHPSTSAFDYEVLHLFLFDFNNMRLIHDRILKEHEINLKTQESKSLESLLSSGKREINDVKKIELAELQSKYDNFQISKEYERENDELNLIQEKININKANITSLYLDKDVWERRLLEATTKIDSIDVETIDYMYKEANIYNIDIQKKFEETIQFHAQMLDNEIEFINKSIQKSIALINDFESQHVLLANEYSELLGKLGSSGSLAEYTRLGNQINSLTKDIAETESLINQYQRTIGELSEYRIEFDRLTIEIQKLLDNMRRKIAIFNRYFSEYSKALTEDAYYLTIDQDKNNHFNLVPRCENEDSHVGDGRKQSVIIAFDLAYVSFSNDAAINLVRPHFFTQDKIEIIDVNILNKLIHLVNSVDCQFIFPIIADKLNGLPDFDEDNVILTLSENNKFFNIESYNASADNSILDCVA
jgi:uncharacterized protein YydD (DUF2326 family)